MRMHMILPAAGLLTLMLVSGILGGSAFAPDTETIRVLADWRQHRPAVTTPLVWLTQLGGSALLLPIAAVAAAWLLWRREFHSAGWLAATILGGRLMVEFLKWATDRPRPSVDAHPVFVFSQAFPSGHAANSMITYVALALWTLPERLRSSGLVVAILLSLAIGATRPVLGVHWPTDVLGGWSFGVLWTLAMWRYSRPVSPV